MCWLNFFTNVPLFTCYTLDSALYSRRLYARRLENLQTTLKKNGGKIEEKQYSIVKRDKWQIAMILNFFSMFGSVIGSYEDDDDVDNGMRWTNRWTICDHSGNCIWIAYHSHIFFWPHKILHFLVVSFDWILSYWFRFQIELLWIFLSIGYSKGRFGFTFIALCWTFTVENLIILVTASLCTVSPTIGIFAPRTLNNQSHYSGEKRMHEIFSVSNIVLKSFTVAVNQWEKIE